MRRTRTAAKKVSKTRTARTRSTEKSKRPKATVGPSPIQVPGLVDVMVNPGQPTQIFVGYQFTGVDPADDVTTVWLVTPTGQGPIGALSPNNPDFLRLRALPNAGGQVDGGATLIIYAKTNAAIRIPQGTLWTMAAESQKSPPQNF